MAKRGIDISEHQGDIDLSALKSQIDFVIIRVGYGPAGTIDFKFKRNADLCKQLGIPVGFYWYSYALNINEAESEARAFLKAIKPYDPEYGCWFDMEDADSYKKRNGMPSNSTLQDMCYRWCEMVESSGYYAGVYASESWFTGKLAGSRLSRFDKWVAQWPTDNVGKQRGLSVDANSRNGLSLWQFTSAGKFKGYNGSLDTNYAYHDFPRPGSKPTPEPEPKPEKKTNEQLAQEVMNGKWGDGKERKKRLEAAGYDYQAVQDIVNEIYGIKKPAPKKEIKKGDKVKMNGTTDYNGVSLAPWVKGSTFDVIEVSGDRVVIGKGNVVTAAVKKSDLTII